MNESSVTTAGGVALFCRGDCIRINGVAGVILRADGATLTIKSPVPWYWRLRWWVGARWAQLKALLLRPETSE